MLLVGSGMAANWVRSLSRTVAVAWAFCSALTAVWATPAKACSSLWQAVVERASRRARAGKTKVTAFGKTPVCRRSVTQKGYQDRRTGKVCEVGDGTGGLAGLTYYRNYQGLGGFRPGAQ